jgi:drug/metabolite transporter (DMT)-like permease
MPLVGEISALTTAFLWSGSSLVFASATARVGAVQVNITRLILAAVYLGIVVVLFHLESSLSSRQLVNLAVSGIIGLAVGDSFLFKAYKEMGPRITMLIMSLSPAIAAVLGYAFLHEILSLQAVVGMIVTIVGIGIVVLQRGRKVEKALQVTAAGLIFALVGASGQAINLLFAKAAFNEGPIDGFLATFIRIMASLIVLLPAVILSGRWRDPVADFKRDRKAFGLTVAGSILGPFLGISFSLIAIANTSVAIASTLMATVPIIMLPLVRIAYKERPGPQATFGACVAVGGVATLFLR